MDDKITEALAFFNEAHDEKNPRKLISFFQKAFLLKANSFPGADNMIRELPGKARLAIAAMGPNGILEITKPELGWLVWIGAGMR